MNKDDRLFDVIGMSPRDDKDGHSFWDEFFAKGNHLPQHKQDAMVERKKNKGHMESDLEYAERVARENMKGMDKYDAMVERKNNKVDRLDNKKDKKQ